MKIIYKNKIEVKILAIAIGMIFGALYLFVTISDLRIQNSHFWHNQACLWLMALVFSLPIMIVARHRITFDFDQRTVTRRGFLTPEKVYTFSEMDVDYVIVSAVVSKFVFSSGKKVIFKLEELDFIKQTGESSDWLKELFHGEALEIFSIEKRLNSSNMIAYATQYSFAPKLTIYVNNRDTAHGTRCITAEYLIDEDSFLLRFEEQDTTPPNAGGTKLIRKMKLPHNEDFENKLVELSAWVSEGK